MRAPLVSALSLTLSLAFPPNSPSAPASLIPTSVHGRPFQIPAGFEIREVTSSQHVQRPVNACFDDQGRLYVTDSSGSSQPPAEQAKNPLWRVIRLEDTDGDGTFDRSIVFADKLPMLQGILWHQGTVYIGGTPSIWTLKDKDQDGRADERHEWWNVGRPSTHCGNEVHGPYAGPDGYIYWTKGAFEPISWTNSITGKTFHDRGAHIFRARPDGSDMESIMTGGMDNPVEVAFTSDGECLFTSTFIDFSQPGFRDGLAHAIRGGVYGKLNSNIEDLAVQRTSPEVLHPFVQFGAAAPSGLCRYDGTTFGPSFQNSFFATLFNMHKVTHHIVTRKGATFTAETSDFITSDDVDFHPTDVLEGPDGALYVLDTGGWYKLCCPTSQLWKPDMLGHIYRIQKSGAPTRTLSQTHTQSKPAKPTPKIGRTISLDRWQEQLVKAGDDTFAQHEIIYALIQQASPKSLTSGLSHASPWVQRGALIALAERTGSTLTAAQVAPYLSADHEGLRKAAEWIVQRRPAWGTELAQWAGTQFPIWIKAGQTSRITPLLPLFVRDDAGRQLIAQCALKAENGDVLRQSALETMAASGLKNIPDSWIQTITTLLSQDHAAPLLGAALKVVSQLKGVDQAAPIQEAVRSIAHRKSEPPTLQAQALASLPQGATLLDSEFQFLTAQLTSSTAPQSRGYSVRAITRASLTNPQRLQLAALLSQVGPLELSPLLAAFETGGDLPLGKAILDALRQSKSKGSLRAETLKPRLSKFPGEIQAEADQLLASTLPDASRQNARISALLEEIKGLKTDIRHGQAVFNSSKAACVQCHRIGYAGGNVGPDLTKIGEVRTERDLLEAVVFPSASFVRSYEPILLNTKGGDTLSGIIRRETDSDLILIVGPNQEQTISKTDIVDQTPGAVSIMPGGLDEQMSRQELADLIAFLKNTKWGAN